MTETYAFQDFDSKFVLCDLCKGNEIWSDIVEKLSEGDLEKKKMMKAIWYLRKGQN
jgi:hypothetical protein